ncbi:MAG: exosortase/archaeosortase family protein, partial [Planctomycetales bacterium]|nr:exosortase/archaeosortase family protein [Planctomycetales bacterium]
MKRRISWHTVILLLGFAALFVWSYGNTLLSLVDVWRSNPDYQHGFAVLPVAVAILWRRRYELESETEVSLWGLVPIALAAAMRCFAVRFYFMELDAWSMLIWLCGAFWVAGGFRFLSWAAPAILFLGFAAPLPTTIEMALSYQLQHVAAAGSAFTLQCFGRPAILDGTTVLLNGIELDIEHACSGLRMFFGTFAVAFGFGMLGKAGNRITALLVLLAIPVSVIANIVRISATGLMFELTNDEIARRLEHDFAGIATMLFVLFTFVCVSLQIKRWRIASDRNPHAFARRIAFWPITIALILGGVFYIHHVQAKNALGQLVSLAQQAEAMQSQSEVARYWDLVLRMAPRHTAALEKLSEILIESHDSNARQRALQLATRACTIDPTNLDFAKHRIEIANALSAHGDTIAAANRILSNPAIGDPVNREYLRFASRWKANAVYSLMHSLDSPGQLTWEDLGEALERAIKDDPGYPQHYLRLAINYRTRIKSRGIEELAEAADNTIKLMMDKNSESSEAWLARYRYAQQFQASPDSDEQQLAEIDSYLDRALELHRGDATKNAHILVSGAERERQRGNIMESVKLFEQAIAVDPADARPYLAISQMVVQPGIPESLDTAIEVLHDGIR